MSSYEHAWVVCAPGDPTKRQWQVIAACAAGAPYCADGWNTENGDVAFVVSQAQGGGEDVRFVVSTNGQLYRVDYPAGTIDYGLFAARRLY